MQFHSKLKKCLSTGVIFSCLAAGAAFAHHGWSGYDNSKELNLSGVIQESSYGNPHGTLELKVAGENTKTWTIADCRQAC